jgi:DNA invertase Pin-like site-specific DNA recombinase
MECIGYARVSTTEQNLDLQIDALHAAGCKKVYKDMMSGAKADRPGLEDALDYLREGDTLVVWRLDRLGRSLQHLIETVNKLESRNVGFKSLTEQIDTTTPGGMLIFHIFGALAEFERNLIRERTNAGLKAARARGRLGGRPKAINKIDPKVLALAKQLYETNQTPNEQIWMMLKVSEATFYRIAKTWK